MNTTDLLRNLFIMALADGEISPEELSLIAEHRHRWGMAKTTFDATLREAQAPQARLQLPDHPDDRNQLLCDMAAVRMEIDSEELDDFD